MHGFKLTSRICPLFGINIILLLSQVLLAIYSVHALTDFAVSVPRNKMYLGTVRNQFVGSYIAVVYVKL